MVKDEWMRAAMSDDTLVVEILVRLKHSQSPLSPPPPPPPLLTWTVRMPRSRALRCGHGFGESSARCSPTTPLSWSAGAASPSAATADGGFEEDSGRSPSLPRSKGRAINNELVSTTTTTSRRSRRKKTFSELKEQESLLLKEKVHLKKELTKLRATFREQTTENERLKRMKLQIGLHSAVCAEADVPKRLTSSQQHQSTTASTPASHSTHHRDHLKPEPHVESRAVNENRSGFFLLPDLNSLPCEDDYCPGTS